MYVSFAESHLQNLSPEGGSLKGQKGEIVMVAYGCHILFLKIVISLVKTVYLCFYVFTPMCHLSDCHVHCVYVCTTEFIN
jgi:hypothetical protein